MWWHWRHWLTRLVAALSLLAVVAMTSAVAVWATTARAEGDDPVLLRELAERLLAPPYPGPGGQVVTARLLPGQLPSGLPLDLPVAPGSRLVGSSARQAGDQPLAWDIVFDAPGTAADLLTFYQDALAEQGFTAPAANGPAGPRGGFQPSVAVSTRFFCPARGGTPWLSLAIGAGTTDPRDVRVHLNTSTPGPCNVPPGSGPGATRLPPLYLPAGVQFTGGSGGSGGPNRETSSATVTTEATPAALEADFAEQLRAAGWTRLDGQAGDTLAWSTWQVPGPGNAQGFLYVLRTGAKGRDLSLQVEAPTPLTPAAPR